MTPSVQTTIKHTLKILQEILQDFSRVFDHFVETRRYRVKLKFFDIAFFLGWRRNK